MRTAEELIAEAVAVSSAVSDDADMGGALAQLLGSEEGEARELLIRIHREIQDRVIELALRQMQPPDTLTNRTVSLVAGIEIGIAAERLRNA